MRSLPGFRGGLVLVSGLTAALMAGACSKTPHFVNDLAGGNGGSGPKTGTSASSTSTGTGGAAPRPCVTAADCGMVDTECAHPTCEQGQCGVDFPPMGTPTQGQVPWDCKKNVCDGAGHVVQVNDDTDLPDDGNDCTDDTCLNGVPSHGHVAQGAMCGNEPSMSCDGAGHCTNCNVALDCGAPGPCFTWACSGGVCEQVFVPMGSGTPGGGTAGDCRRNVCDGKGGAVTIEDPDDPPADPSACLLATCTGTVPATKPAALGVACFGGACDGQGNCGACSSDADCGAPTACATPKCVGGHCSAIFVAAGTATPQQTPGDCKKNVCDGAGQTTTANDDTDVPPNPDECTTAGCANGAPTLTPVPVPSSGDPCIVDGCNPQTGIFHDPLPDNTPCGGCSTCQGAVCTDGCGMIGCQCFGDVCTNCF